MKPSYVQGCLLVKPAEELLFALFQLDCQDDLNLDSALVDRIRTTWCLGIKAMMCQKGGLLMEDGFFQKAARHIYGSVHGEFCTLDR